MIGEIRFVLLERGGMERCLDENKPDTNKGVSGRCCWRASERAGEEGDFRERSRDNMTGRPIFLGSLENNYSS